MSQQAMRARHFLGGAWMRVAINSLGIPMARADVPATENTGPKDDYELDQLARTGAGRKRA